MLVAWLYGWQFRFVSWLGIPPHSRLKYLNIRWIAMKFGGYINGIQRMNPTDCSDPLTFPIAPPGC